MSLYIRMMTDVINQIEHNISDHITLQNLSRQFCLSEFHFSRLFRAIIGKSPKQYILERKLSLAGIKLKETDISVIDIAYDFGFKYPEVFSRAFRKQFGVSPNVYRKGEYDLEITQKASIVQRDIINHKGLLALKEDYIFIETFYLSGVKVEVNEYSDDFEDILKVAGEAFAAEHEHFYSVVNCHGAGDGKYSVFFGEKVLAERNENDSDIRKIPGGWYAQFNYNGEMLDMRTTFVDDLYRWMIIKEIEVSSNGIGMLNIFNTADIMNVKILIPVKEPK